MHRIQAVCLGHKENFTSNCESIEQLKTEVSGTFAKYLNKRSSKRIPVKFILTYKDQKDGTEKLLTSMDVLNETKNTQFHISVKRVSIIIVIQS
jgi:hypothetical protein